MAGIDWKKRAEKGFWASGIDPSDRKGLKNHYIDLLQKMALSEAMEIKGDEIVLDFGCGSGRISYWIAPKVKEVKGLEITPEMIQLAEEKRTSKNVEFMLYDGLHFPVFSFSFDLLLSVGVLQIMKGERLKETLSRLSEYLKKDGKIFLIEQVSDNPGIDRPNLNDYFDAFDSSSLECLRHHPIRKGRWWGLYLIRYGLIPDRFLHRIASWELKKNRHREGTISYYKDYLFLLRKK
jgi:SAM-dependent methyltransferase